MMSGSVFFILFLLLFNCTLWAQQTEFIASAMPSNITQSPSMLTEQQAGSAGLILKNSYLLKQLSSSKCLMVFPHKMVTSAAAISFEGYSKYRSKTIELSGARMFGPLLSVGACIIASQINIPETEYAQRSVTMVSSFKLKLSDKLTNVSNLNLTSVFENTGTDMRVSTGWAYKTGKSFMIQTGIEKDAERIRFTSGFEWTMKDQLYFSALIATGENYFTARTGYQFNRFKLYSGIGLHRFLEPSFHVMLFRNLK